jgi:hypothetical protein
MCKISTIDLTEADRHALTVIVTDRNGPQKHVWRAQIVLLTADGCGTMELTRRTGTSKTLVCRASRHLAPKWRRAWLPPRRRRLRVRPRIGPRVRWRAT